MNLFSRREFITTAAAGASAVLGGCAIAPGAHRKKLPIGVQLYSVRNDFPKDVPGVLAGIKKLGFDGVEFAGYASKPAGELRKILDDNGLKVCGSHLPGALRDLADDHLDATIEFNQTLGNDKLIVASVRATTVDDWKRLADQFSAIGEKLKPHKMRVGYHNHATEFKAIDGQVPEDVFFGKTGDNVFMQLDIGHGAHAGADPAVYIMRYGAKLVSVHVKDWIPANGGDTVGDGIVKWDAVLDACAGASALQWYIIEEESNKYPGLEGIDKDIKSFKKLLSPD